MTETWCEIIFKGLDHGMEQGKRVQKATSQTELSSTDRR